MDSAKSEVGLVRNFAKILRFKASGVAPDDGIGKIKSLKKAKGGSFGSNRSKSLEDEEKLRQRAAMEAFLAKLFASISSVKAAYAQLQISQSPYDSKGIQSADEKVVFELKRISELKKCFLKKQIDESPQVTQLLAEIQEQQSLMKTYEIMVKKFESQLKLKDSEITNLKEKFKDSDRKNRSLEKRLNLNHSSDLSILDGLRLSGLNQTHFVTVLRYAIKSIRSFVKLLMDQMGSAGWDFDKAASSIEPGVVYAKQSHKSFAFESFVCREMFDGFHFPNFSLSNELLPERRQQWRHQFFEKFTELNSEKAMEFLARRSNSTFGKFCQAKYFHLIHPKMESSFFGDLNQRSLVNSGRYPETPFFVAFAEMAKWVWLLHCLAFSFEPEASIFMVRKEGRFSEIYMETVNEDAISSTKNSPENNPVVGFTVFPGFKIGKIIVQSLVYLSPA